MRPDPASLLNLNSYSALGNGRRRRGRGQNPFLTAVIYCVNLVAAAAAMRPDPASLSKPPNLATYSYLTSAAAAVAPGPHSLSSWQLADRDCLLESVIGFALLSHSVAANTVASVALAWLWLQKCTIIYILAFGLPSRGSPQINNSVNSNIANNNGWLLGYNSAVAPTGECIYREVKSCPLSSE